MYKYEKCNIDNRMIWEDMTLHPSSYIQVTNLDMKFITVDNTLETYSSVVHVRRLNKAKQISYKEYVWVQVSEMTGNMKI